MHIKNDGRVFSALTNKEIPSERRRGVTDKEQEEYERSQVAPKAKPPPKPSIKSYAAAELSLLAHGPVPLPVYSHRLNCCTGSPCKHLKSDDGGQYCGSCGCGTRERARLKVKLHMPAAECPKGIWGKEQGEGILQLRRIGGLLAQVKAIIKNIKDELTGKNKEAKDG